MQFRLASIVTPLAIILHAHMASAQHSAPELAQEQATSSDPRFGALIPEIVRAFRPCYRLGDLFETPGANIIVALRIRPEPDGTVSPESISVYRVRGITEENFQYSAQFIEAARNAVSDPNCPFPDLPSDLYANGWSDFVLNFIPASSAR